MTVEIMKRRAIALLVSTSDFGQKSCAPLYIVKALVFCPSVCVVRCAHYACSLRSLPCFAGRLLRKRPRGKERIRCAAIGSFLRFQFSYSGKTKNFRLNNGDTSDRKLTPWISYLVRQKQAPCGWYPLAAYLGYLPKTIAFR